MGGRRKPAERGLLPERAAEGARHGRPREASGREGVRENEVVLV